MDKKLKPLLVPTGIYVKNTSAKTSKAVRIDVPEDNINNSLLTNMVSLHCQYFGLAIGTGSSLSPKSIILASLPVVPFNTSHSLPLANTELSLIAYQMHFQSKAHSLKWKVSWIVGST